MIHIHWMREIRRSAVWAYEECRCGKRKVRRISWGYSPIDPTWLGGKG